MVQTLVLENAQQLETLLGIPVTIERRGPYNRIQVWIKAKGWIEGIGETKQEAFEDFCWRNRIPIGEEYLVSKQMEGES